MGGILAATQLMKVQVRLTRVAKVRQALREGRARRGVGDLILGGGFWGGVDERWASVSDCVLPIAF